MHELALAEGVLTIVLEEARRARAARVSRITLSLGALSHVDEAALRQGLAVMAAGTLAETAAICVETPPGQAWCMACGINVTIDRRGQACPVCDGQQLLVTGGDTMQVTALEVV